MDLFQAEFVFCPIGDLLPQIMKHLKQSQEYNWIRGNLSRSKAPALLPISKSYYG